MFDVLYELLDGRARELPRRRRFTDPRLDDTGTVFLAPEEPQHTGWLGRGAVPGVRATAVEELVVDDPQSLVDEIRALAQTPRR